MTVERQGIKLLPKNIVFEAGVREMPKLICEIHKLSQFVLKQKRAMDYNTTDRAYLSDLSLQQFLVCFEVNTSPSCGELSKPSLRDWTVSN